MREQGTPFSDIDLVVIFPKLVHAIRESFALDGWPVEAFVNDAETLLYFFDEVDSKVENPSLHSMVAEGEVFPAQHPRGVFFKELALRNADEIIGTCAALYDLLANYYLRARGHWATGPVIANISSSR